MNILWWKMIREKCTKGASWSAGDRDADNEKRLRNTPLTHYLIFQRTDEESQESENSCPITQLVGGVCSCVYFLKSTVLRNKKGQEPFNTLPSSVIPL